jgi:tetratricopeptide (TPR) repeat protein
MEDSLRACPEEATEPVWTYRVIVYALEDIGDLEGAKAAARRWEEHSLKSSFWSQVAYARQEQDLCRLRLGQLSPAELRAQLPRYLADLKAKAGADVVAGQGPKLAMWHASALGERREALAAALKDEVPAVYTQFLIAESYAGLGQHEKAVEWYRRLLTKPDEEMIPTIFVRTRFRLAEALDALGRADEARAAYASFLAAWGKADRPLPSVAKARERLAALPEKAAPP